MTSEPQRAACPSEIELTAFLEGRLSSERALHYEDHIDSCAACFALFGALGGRPEDSPDAAQVPAVLAETPVADLASAAFEVPAAFDEFRLLRPLGRGAMGQVYLGHDTLLDRSVAIKFLAASQPDQATRERFLTEARAIARLQHANVVAAYRFGEVQGRPYLVSEFIGGQSLDTLPRPVPWEQAQRIGLGLARGLGLAHRRGVLHRDIKPANAIMAPDGQVKLLDFGLAKLLERQPGAGESQRSPEVPAASPTLTRAGAVVGTPLYLAPELWDGAPASRRSDLYALGALLYDLCSGRPPHREKTMEALRRAAQERDVTPLLQVAPGVGALLAEVVDRCLRRDPAERPATCEELCRALEGAAPQRREPPWGEASDRTRADREATDANNDDSLEQVFRRRLPLLDREALECDRTEQWQAMVAMANRPGHEILLLPGGASQGHPFFLMRVRLCLPVRPPMPPPTSVGLPNYYPQSGYAKDYEAALAEALRCSEDHLVAALRRRLSRSNLVLVHELHLAGGGHDDDDGLAECLTEWLPNLLERVGPTLLGVKCVQALSWAECPAWMHQVARYLGLPRRAALRWRTERLCRQIQAAQHRLMPVLRLPNLAPIDEQDIRRYCQTILRLPEPEIAAFIRAVTSAETTSAGIMAQIERNWRRYAAKMGPAAARTLRGHEGDR